MRKIKNSLKNVKRALTQLRTNIKYLSSIDLYEREKQRTFELTDKIIEDCIYEFDEDKKLLRNLDILDADESVELLMKSPKSFCRLGDGEIKLMQGIDQEFQVYDKNLAAKLKNLLTEYHDDMYVGINRAYFHTPITCSEENRRFYRIYSTSYRRFFLGLCNTRNKYIDAGFLTAYFRFDENYDYEAHYHKMELLFEGKKIAVVCGQGILEKLEYDVFMKATDKIMVYGPSRNAYSKYSSIMNEISAKVPKDYIVCLILGMTAKIMVPELTHMGYMAWDVGHLAKDYNAYMTKVEKNKENITRFWAAD